MQQLVDGSGASCSEIEKIISVDQKAIKFEKDKLDAAVSDLTTRSDAWFDTMNAGVAPLSLALLTSAPALQSSRTTLGE